MQLVERLQTDVRNLLRSNTNDLLHLNVHFEARINMISISIKQIRDHMKIYIERKKKQLGVNSRVYILDISDKIYIECIF